MLNCALSGHRSFVNGKLLGRFLQFDGEFMIRLIDTVVFSVRPESGRNHLNANFTVRDTRGFRLAVLMGLQLQPFLLLLAMLVDEMNHHLSIFNWFAAGISDDRHVDGSGLLLQEFSFRQRKQSKRTRKAGKLGQDVGYSWLPYILQPEWLMP